ncbi:MAG: cupin-like domain-containing protein [Bacteroidia bacterium]
MSNPTNGEIKTVTVDRRSNLSYAEFRNEYLIPRKPVVITDATAAWKASSWTPQWFRDSYPGKKIQTDQGEMVMEEFIDAIIADDTEAGPFLREQPLEEVFPDLANHVQPVPVYVKPNWLGGNYILPRVTKRLNRESHLEINFCGRRIFPYLHIDDLKVHAFINQHYGDKNLVVFPPDQEQFLYRVPGQRVSQVFDVDNPDLEKFPLFANAKPIRLVLHAGESVFMPCGWWHTTRVPGASLSTVFSIANSSNWNELVDQVETELSHRPKMASVFCTYMRSVGFLKGIFG